MLFTALAVWLAIALEIVLDMEPETALDVEPETALEIDVGLVAALGLAVMPEEPATQHCGCIRDVFA